MTASTYTEHKMLSVMAEGETYTTACCDRIASGAFKGCAYVMLARRPSG